MRKDPNARFWLMTGKGAVKLTLAPGEQLRFSEGGPTDEGYSYTGTEVTYDAERGKLLLAVTTNARDCDGPLQTWDDYLVDVRDLKKIPSSEDPGISYPNWERWASGQYDAYAAAAGY